MTGGVVQRLLFRNLAILALVMLCVALLYQHFTRDRDSPRILVFQDKPEEWADALKLGFDNALRADPVGKRAIVVTESAASDPQAETNLAQSIANEHYTMVYALGTQATQEVFQALKGTKTPIIFGAVTDPVAAGLYQGSLNKPGGNITGTQDIWPYSAQFDLMMQLVPNVKKLGIVYNSSEVNSQVSVALIERECQRRGISLMQRAVTEPSQISLAVQSLIQNKIDAFFVPADNTAQGNSQVIIAACFRAHIPVFTGISGIVQNGALGTVGTNYVELGKVNAKQAIDILKGKEAKDISVLTADQGDLYLNQTSADKLGIKIPDALLKRAVMVYR
jgi:putative ABC transport system substrate-binding protein